MFSMKSVTTKAQIDALVQSTYIEAVIFAVVALVVAFIIASIIKWQGKPDRSYIKRRVSWIIVGIIFPMIFWLINATYVSGFIQKSSWSGQFGKANIIATLVCLVAYFAVSIITMFIFRSTKWGSILGPSKKN